MSKPKKLIVTQTGHTDKVMKEMSKFHGTTDQEIGTVISDRNARESDLKAAGYSRAARRSFFHMLKQQKKVKF